MINKSINQSTGLFIWQLVIWIETSVQQNCNAIMQLHQDNQLLANMLLSRHAVMPLVVLITVPILYFYNTG